MESSSAKEILRGRLPSENISPNKFGKLAESVRRLDGYRECRQIFVSPGEILWQVRINALLDQKELIMPTGGLKQGFVRFRPNTIPFNQLGYAVSFKGMEKFGEYLTRPDLEKLDVGLCLVDSEAVDRQGGRLGDGLGFTDLAIAILRGYDAIHSEALLFSVVAENRVLQESLPDDPWDIKLDGIITLGKIDYLKRDRAAWPTILWPALPLKRIRKIQPLWDMYCANNPLQLASED